MTVATGKVNLLGMTRSQLEAFFVSLGEKPFRAHQVMKWIHFFGVDSFEGMTNLNDAKGKSIIARLVYPREEVKKQPGENAQVSLLLNL